MKRQRMTHAEMRRRHRLFSGLPTGARRTSVIAPGFDQGRGGTLLHDPRCATSRTGVTTSRVLAALFYQPPEYGNAPPRLGVTSVTPNPVACFIVDCVLGVYFSTAPDIHLLVYFEDLTDSFRCFTRGVGLVRIHLKNKLNGSLNMEFEIIIQSLANIPRT